MWVVIVDESSMYHCDQECGSMIVNRIVTRADEGGP